MALISGTMSHSVPLDHCCSCVSAFNLITDLPLCVSIFIKIWCSQSFQEQVYTFGLNGNRTCRQICFRNHKFPKFYISFGIFLKTSKLLKNAY